MEVIILRDSHSSIAVEVKIMLGTLYCFLINLAVCALFHFGFRGGIWDLIVLVPDHCIPFRSPGSSVGLALAY